MSERPFQIHAIGEVAIRVTNMDAMIEFYQHVLGFRLLRRFGNDVAALRIAEGVYGQVQTLTLFGETLPPNHPDVSWAGLRQASTTLHHFALTVAPNDYDAILDYFKQLNVVVNTANHRWVGWRGIYVRDPENNIVELVSYHEEYDEGKTGDYDFGKLHGGSPGAPFA